MTDRTLDPEVTRYLAVSSARLAPRTIEAYRRDLVAFGNWFVKPMAEVQREDVERYLADLRAQGLASTTIARRAAALRSFLRHQVLIGARPDNPAAEVGRASCRERVLDHV